MVAPTVPATGEPEANQVEEYERLAIIVWNSMRSYMEFCQTIEYSDRFMSQYVFHLISWIIDGTWAPEAWVSPQGESTLWTLSLSSQSYTQHVLQALLQNPDFARLFFSIWNSYLQYRDLMICYAKYQVENQLKPDPQGDAVHRMWGRNLKWRCTPDSLMRMLIEAVQQHSRQLAGQGVSLDHPFFMVELSGDSSEQDIFNTKVNLLRLRLEEMSMVEEFARNRPAIRRELRESLISTGHLGAVYDPEIQHQDMEVAAEQEASAQEPVQDSAHGHQNEPPLQRMQRLQNEIRVHELAIQRVENQIRVNDLTHRLLRIRIRANELTQQRLLANSALIDQPLEEREENEIITSHSLTDQPDERDESDDVTSHTLDDQSEERNESEVNTPYTSDILEDSVPTQQEVEAQRLQDFHRLVEKNKLRSTYGFAIVDLERRAEGLGKLFGTLCKISHGVYPRSETCFQHALQSLVIAVRAERARLRGDYMNMSEYHIKMHELCLRELLIIHNIRADPRKAMDLVKRLQAWVYSLIGDFRMAAKLHGKDSPIQYCWGYPSWPAGLEMPPFWESVANFEGGGPYWTALPL